jgi:hypothetical protein
MVLFNISVSVTIPDRPVLSETIRQEILLRHMIFAAETTVHAGLTVAIFSLIMSLAFSQAWKLLPVAMLQVAPVRFLVDDDLIAFSVIAFSFCRRSPRILPCR